MTSHGAHPTRRDDKPEPLCRCSGTTADHIRRCFERGETDLESLSRATGAGSGCGACDTDILALLAELTDESAEEKHP